MDNIYEQLKSIKEPIMLQVKVKGNRDYVIRYRKLFPTGMLLWIDSETDYQACYSCFIKEALTEGTLSLPDTIKAMREFDTCHHYDITVFDSPMLSNFDSYYVCGDGVTATYMLQYAKEWYVKSKE